MSNSRGDGSLRAIAVLGNHIPRQCGIATFTTDLCSALALARPKTDCFALAMNDGEKRYKYPERVRFEVPSADVGAYRRAADFLNVNAVDVLSVQHEYGIFGGKAGHNVLALLRELRMPIVTTLHTILAAPDAAQRLVMDELVQLSERLVVMSADGGDLLAKVHEVPRSKIDLIPHGIPATVPAEGSKFRLGVEDRMVLLTFGLLSPDKGIEHMIDALPAILERFPRVVYVVLGATHPHILEQYGESYRLMLAARAERLGVDSHVIFHDRFVSQSELADFMDAADIYITPYLKEEQATSGTLAYAVGAGKAVISTPYRYAREMLADGCGALVPWASPEALSHEVIRLFGDPAAREAMKSRALARGQAMTWPVVANAYLTSFQRAGAERHGRLQTAFQARTLATRQLVMPEIKLNHLRLLTDDTGILQHASFGVPRYSDGYCTDDNARALLLTALLEEVGGEDPGTLRPLASRYLAFVNYAFDPLSGRFRNFMTYDRRWVPEVGSDDSHGRTLWALGTVIGRSTDPGRKNLASDLFHAALPRLDSLTSPRAWAYALMGIDQYLLAFAGDSNAQSLLRSLAERLLYRLDESSDASWPWFEDRLTYCNARLAQALIVAGARLEQPDLTARGLASLEWLVSVQAAENGQFAPIGTNGHYVRGGPKASFDQQPVEVAATLSACLSARRVSQDERWMRRAQKQFGWFLGHNPHGRALYDAATGGCRDGLHVDRLNENQGAESTLSFLLAQVELRIAATLYPKLDR